MKVLQWYQITLHWGETFMNWLMVYLCKTFRKEFLSWNNFNCVHGKKKQKLILLSFFDFLDQTCRIWTSEISTCFQKIHHFQTSFTRSIGYILSTRDLMAFLAVLARLINNNNNNNNILNMKMFDFHFP